MKKSYSTISKIFLTLALALLLVTSVFGCNGEYISERPRPVGPIYSISAGGDISAVIDANGHLWIWGERGHLSDRINYEFWHPTKMAGEIQFVQVSAGSRHVLALDIDGNLWGWGGNFYWQLGSAVADARPYTLMYRILEDIQFKSIATGAFHSMAIDVDDNLWTWGSNSLGQLGRGYLAHALRHEPAKTLPGRRVSKIFAGSFHSMAMDIEGYLWVWGSNRSYQLTDSFQSNVYMPQALSVLSNELFIAQIDLGYEHSSVKDNQGNLWVWGRNFEEQSGVSRDFGNYVTAPAKILISSRIVDFSVGWLRTYAIDDEGYLWAWGLLYNNGVSSRYYFPQRIFEHIHFKSISAGLTHALAIDKNGDLWAWGGNGFGQLGIYPNRLFNALMKVN